MKENNEIYKWDLPEPFSCKLSRSNLGFRSTDSFIVSRIPTWSADILALMS